MNDFLNSSLARNKFQKLIKTFSKSDKNHILKALQLATTAHKNQQRDEGVPYIIHPIRVAICLIETLNISDKHTLQEHSFMMQLKIQM
jgi:(p)ppGpp synthase/HD superfamily hydrolase